MRQTIFYQSSLPRAGSTLLQNIIGQNPKFHVTPTSGMIDLMLGTRIGYNGNNESKAGDKDMWREGFYSYCREGFKGYVKTITDKPYILDKNRAWGSYYNLINKINPDPKIIFMVRDLREIFSSMEKIFRKHPDIDDGMLNNSTLSNITTHQRVETWASGHPIGYAVNKLNQSILDKTAQNFLFIRYEDLCDNPQSQIDSIYSFLGLEPFIHDFKNIPQVTVEDDSVHGIYGDHIIRNTLGMLPDDSKEVLGEYTSNWIYNHYKWYYDIFGYQK
jgi:sulfotransferase